MGSDPQLYFCFWIHFYNPPGKDIEKLRLKYNLTFTLTFWV